MHKTDEWHSAVLHNAPISLSLAIKCQLAKLTVHVTSHGQGRTRPWFKTYEY